eukprot:1865681-Heterocapsa_arctica.AAC.1
MQKPDGGKGGKGGGTEPYKQGWNASGWKMLPQGWVDYSPMQPQGGSQQSGWSSKDDWAPNQGYDQRGDTEGQPISQEWPGWRQQ